MNYIFDKIKRERRRRAKIRKQLESKYPNGSVKPRRLTRTYYHMVVEEMFEFFLEKDPKKRREAIIRIAATVIEIIECLDSLPLGVLKPCKPKNHALR